MNIETLIDELTLEEKVLLLAGHDFWTTAPIERLNIPQIKVTDGPNGARGSEVRSGPAAACFPCGSALAATWNEALLHDVGAALAEQVKAKGAHILLAPTVNIHRTPVAGRNFECYSEDPYLTARMAINVINGLQAAGVGACIKHFIANDQEFERRSISSEVDERTLHEIYLEPFRAVVAEASPWAIMSSYNKLNGTYCSEDKALLIDLLKEKWGFDGIVMSDWFGSYSDGAAAGGLDLEMPGKARWLGENVLKMVQSGELDEAIVDDKVRRLLRTIERSGADKSDQNLEEETVLDRPEDRALIRQAGAEAIVLLKNERDLLPLNNDNGVKRIAVIGVNAEQTRYQGGGSAYVPPPYLVSPLEGIMAAKSDETVITYTAGCPIYRRLPMIDGIDLTVAYHNDLAGDSVYTEMKHNSEIVWFGGMRDGLNDGFSVKISGSYTPTESGVHQFSLACIGSGKVTIGEATLEAIIDPASVTTPFEMWDHEKIGQVTLTAGETVEISAEYVSPAGALFQAIRFGLTPKLFHDPIEDAVEAAAQADVAIIVAGLNEEWESEGFDRVNMDLPGRQNEMIARVVAANRNTIIVLNTGSPVHMPWLDDVAAVLQAWYLGQEQGNAIADILFGNVNPSGKLPTTFPVRYEDNPAYINYPGENGQVRYGEGLFVGYRYYDKKQIAPLFPFGHGLSYTTFEYSALNVAPAGNNGNDVEVTVNITNKGGRAGAEIVQVYVRDEACRLVRPEKELKAFAKVAVAAGATETVTLTLPRSAFGFYDPAQSEWVVEGNKFEILVGRSAGDIQLNATVTI